MEGALSLDVRFRPKGGGYALVFFYEDSFLFGGGLQNRHGHDFRDPHSVPQSIATVYAPPSHRCAINEIEMIDADLMPEYHGGDLDIVQLVRTGGGYPPPPRLIPAEPLRPPKGRLGAPFRGSTTRETPEGGGYRRGTQTPRFDPLFFPHGNSGDHQRVDGGYHPLRVPTTGEPPEGGGNLTLST